MNRPAIAFRGDPIRRGDNILGKTARGVADWVWARRSSPEAAALSLLVCAVLLGLTAFAPSPFPSQSFTVLFDSYNDGCARLSKDAKLEGSVYLSKLGPLVGQGRPGGFLSRFSKTPGQQVRIRYKNYPSPGFSFDLVVEGNHGRARAFHDRPKAGQGGGGKSGAPPT